MIFLSYFLKQYSIAAIYITLTLYLLLQVILGTKKLLEA